MKTLFCANDLHLAAKRSGGTTTLSALALREYLLQSFKNLLSQVDGDLIINGDWLDSYTVDSGDLLRTYEITCDWLCKGHKLWCSRGNHDAVVDSTKTSSFDLLVSLLEHRFPEQVFGISEPTAIPEHDAYVIPHLINQAAFDEAVSNVPGVKTLYLHVNFDNFFALQADHSLNLTVEQAKSLPVEKIIIAHEHTGRSELNGKVLVVGNNFPSSISDCLNNTEKSYLKGWERKVFWRASDSFVEQDWQALASVSENAEFVRVTGKATSAQAADVIAEISKYRATSSAFVVSNAVEIAGLDDNTTLSLSQEQITSFSVLDALTELLDKDENAIIKSLLEK